MKTELVDFLKDFAREGKVGALTLLFFTLLCSPPPHQGGSQERRGDIFRRNAGQKEAEAGEWGGGSPCQLPLLSSYRHPNNHYTITVNIVTQL